ncbi:MAG: DNA polymerase III subunit beta [Sulfuricaulis sp.]|uniref:DNA polymerase III subunit beta n=1 Tax=Sulfuricaulis sp. TaxID=2003553 RepID=UPI0025E8F67B|nr:DNA polymerase III subunit beta [Sulfuricaulis sp.]MCR4345737.1 DNA polymerase III subunit beta [Sulfuricaulis sp.]
MQITITREDLLKPLGYVAGVVERRQTLPVLSYILLRQKDGEMTLTGTDLEIEVIAKVGKAGGSSAEMTLPARKLFDICRALPNDAEITIKKEGEKSIVKSGKSRFALATVPVADFPSVQASQWEQALTLKQNQLRGLLEKTHFCMAQQDVRYYLNGLLLEVSENKIRGVATDGHRMAISESSLEKSVKIEKQVIVPRKGVQEMLRLLSDTDDQIELEFGTNHIRARAADFIFTSKLIDGRYPDYNKVIPGKQSKKLKLDRNLFRETLGRVAILSSEKYRGVRLSLSNKTLRFTAHNPEQEEAQEEISADYTGEGLEIGFNVNYMIEAISALHTENIEFGLNDPNSSCTLASPEMPYPQYVIMPMRL